MTVDDITFLVVGAMLGTATTVLIHLCAALAERRRRR